MMLFYILFYHCTKNRYISFVMSEVFLTLLSVIFMVTVDGTDLMWIKSLLAAINNGMSY